jgi:hypothetical protein
MMSVLWPQQAPLLRKVLAVLGQLQESMQIVVETTRHFGHHLDNLREMVHGLKDEAAIDEQFKSTNPTLCLSTSEILPLKLPEPLESSAHAKATKEDFKKADPAPGLFLTEPQSQPFLEPSGSFTAPPTKTLATLTPIGIGNIKLTNRSISKHCQG